MNLTARMRLRELRMAIGTLPTGPLNAITDVAGVGIGHVTLIEDSPHVVRSGVTAIVPRACARPERQTLFRSSA